MVFTNQQAFARLQHMCFPCSRLHLAYQERTFCDLVKGLLAVGVSGKLLTVCQDVFMFYLTNKPTQGFNTCVFTHRSLGVSGMHVL